MTGSSSFNAAGGAASAGTITIVMDENISSIDASKMHVYVLDNSNVKGSEISFLGGVVQVQGAFLYGLTLSNSSTNEDYIVEFDVGALTDAAGNSNIALTGVNAYSFDTTL